MFSIAKILLLVISKFVSVTQPTKSQVLFIVINVHCLLCRLSESFYLSVWPAP